MQITEEKIDELNAILKVQVKKEDYEPKLEKALTTYRKQADLKGFRKGQVPKGLIKKMYGNHLLADTVNDVLSAAVNSHIVDNKIDILGHPLPKNGQEFDLDINNMKDFEFEYEIGLAPDFELDFFKKNKSIEREVPELTEKMIDEEVERMAKRFGEAEEVDKIKEDDDVISVKFIELDEEGKQKEGGINNPSSFTLEMVKDKKDATKIKKLKVGDSIDLNVFETFDRDEASIAKQFLGVELKDLGDNKPLFKVAIETIKRMKSAEINEELLKKVYPDESVKDEAGLRAKIREDVEKYFDEQAGNKLNNVLAERLIEETKMEFPDDFLKRWIQATNEKPITTEQIEAEYDGFRKNLKWSLIIKKIRKDNDIDVSTDEIKEHSATQVKQQLLSYGIPSVSDEETEKFVASMMAREDHVSKTRETILEQKVFDYFKSQIKTKDKKVSLEEFNKQ